MIMIAISGAGIGLWMCRFVCVVYIFHKKQLSQLKRRKKALKKKEKEIKKDRKLNWILKVVDGVEVSWVKIGELGFSVQKGDNGDGQSSASGRCSRRWAGLHVQHHWAAEPAHQPHSWTDSSPSRSTHGP